MLNSVATNRIAWPRIFFMLAMLSLMEAVRVPSGVRKQQNDVSMGLILFVVFLCLGYLARELCPRGPIFTSIDLDEIRIDRFDDIESGLRDDINTLKNKLAFHRKKKTQVQTDRDIKRRLGERVEKFNSKGRDIYGEAWDGGDIPVKAVVAMTTKEVEGLRREAELIAEQRKQEEKEDLWRLWNDIRQDGDQQAPLMGGAAGKSPDKQALLQRGHSTVDTKARAQYKYSAAGSSMAESTRSAQSSASADVRSTMHQSFSSVSRPVFELSDGKFGSPSSGAAAAPATYTYNTNTYNINPSSKTMDATKGSPSGARAAPPVLDLSKLSSPPAHIKPPPTKPPGFASPVPGKGAANSSPLKGRATTNTTATNAEEHAALDRASQRPSMRSYPGGQRPLPPAGPKPPPRPNPDAPSAAAASAGASTAVGQSGRNEPLLQSSGGGAGGGGGVKTMKRPPPPLLAPPPGYIPGNSARGGHLRNSARGSGSGSAPVDGRQGEDNGNKEH